MIVPDGIIQLPPPSLWALRKFSDHQIEKVSERLKQKRKQGGEGKKVLLCRGCSQLITTLERKIEICGNHSHTFRNPAGVVYTIGCFSTAGGCFNFGDPTLEYTWFPGYAWSFSNCINCFMHLGWFYQSGDSHFFGLILSHLVEAERNAAPSTDN